MPDTSEKMASDPLTAVSSEIKPIVDPLLEGDSEMAALMRAHDWTTTPLGAPQGWPQSLRTMVRVLLTSRYAMWLGWGSDLTFFYNDAYSPTLGTKHPWALGRSAREVWAEIWPQIGPRIDRVLQTGKATWDEGLLLFLERSGYPEETYHTFSYSPLPDDSGAVGGMLCVVTEETERIVGERRLAILRELSSHLTSINTTGEVFAAVERSLARDARDLPFTLTYLFEDEEAQTRLASRTGLPETHPMAVTTTDPAALASAWSLPDLDRMDDALVALPAGADWPTGPGDRPATHAIAVPIAQQGQIRLAGVMIAGLNPHRPLDDAYRSFIRLFVGQVTAGLANARAYEAERRRAEALAEIDRAKTVFFSNVSHEFRTPLTLMLGPTEDALASASRALTGDNLDTLYRNELRLLKLVNALLDFSRIEAGRMQASYEPTDLAQLTTDLASTFRSAVERAGLRFVVTCDALTGALAVDRGMWEQIVLNLLSNALKFTFEGTIEVSLRDVADRVTLSVRDSGIGIAPAEVPRLFERFHRIEGARARTHEGSGIGLALVHDLVRLHGGTIDVESVVGAGTTFTVTLIKGVGHLPAVTPTAGTAATGETRRPRAFVEEALRWLPDARVGSEHTVARDSASANASANGVPLVPGHILVADDNADMRDYLTRLLSVHWSVEAVADGEAALEAIRRRPPAVVLSDVMMPGLDGFELLQALRRDERTSSIPVVMLSARAGDEARVEGLRSGADDYLTKPFSARELVARVNTQLTLAHNRHERARLLTSEQQARQEAEVQKQTLFSLFMQAPVAIAVLRGREYVIELFNASAEKVWGRPRETVINQPLFEALPEIRDQGFKALLDSVYDSGTPFIGKEIRVDIDRHRDRTRQATYFNLVYTPFHNAVGTIEGVLVVGSDVTDQVEARQVIQQSQERLNAALEREKDARADADRASGAKDEFLAMLGHELRNPLAPILTALQLMRLKGITGADKERTIIERQVTHLVGLVDDLLDVSRITRGKIELKHDLVELAEVVAKAIEIASPSLEQRAHTLDVEVPRHGLTVSGDPLRLAQVVSNLLTNAAKYTESKGRVTVRGERDGGDVVLHVSDSGIGIAPDLLPHVFDVFVQGRQSLERSQGGLGLGLAIVRSLVALHDGSVSVHSEGVGRGSEFVVRLPAAERSRANEPTSPTSTAGRSAPASNRRTRILVVDDNEDAADMLVEALSAKGYMTRAAHDGPAALRACAEFKPTVALLDLGLPVMDGYELAGRLRALDDMSDLRLMAVTGYGQDTDRQRSRAAGFDDHLVKPIDLDALEQALSGDARQRAQVRSD